MKLGQIRVGKTYYYQSKAGNPRRCRVENILHLPGTMKTSKGKATTFAGPKRVAKQGTSKVVVSIIDLDNSSKFGIPPRKVIEAIG